jgi:hypothetical protein
MAGSPAIEEAARGRTRVPRCFFLAVRLATDDPHRGIEFRIVLADGESGGPRALCRRAGDATGDQGRGRIRELFRWDAERPTTAAT